MRPIDPETRERLLQQALDGEPLGDRELRDFARLMLEDPDFADEYADTRRILRAAREQPRARPAPGFADRVMAALPEAPPARDAAQARRLAPALGLLALAALAALVYLVPVGGWTRLGPGPLLDGLLALIARGANGVRRLVAFEPGLLPTALATLLAAAAALALNGWMLRPDPHGKES